MTGLSLWWATPARAESHFSAEELARSERLHRPVRRVGLATAVARSGLLVVAAFFLARVADSSGALEPAASTDRSVWWQALTSGRVAVGAAATAAALRLPAIAGDAWFEFRFRRGDAGYEPVPIRSFAITVAALAVGTWLLLTVAAAAGYRLMAMTTRWPLVLSGAVVVGMAAAAMVERPLRRRWAGTERPVDPSDAAGAELAALADRFSLVDFRFFSRQADRTGDAIPDGMNGAVPNACALGVGEHRRVVVSEALLVEDRGTRDFVVAHELVHVVRRHVLIRGLLTGGAVIVAIAVVSQLMSWGWPWHRLDLDPSDPLGLPVLILVVAAVGSVLGLPLSWASRLQERSADAGAAAAVGPLSAQAARRLHLATSGDLDPPRWMRFHSQHPTPAERLEHLARWRRATGVERAGPESTGAETRQK